VSVAEAPARTCWAGRSGTTHPPVTSRNPQHTIMPQGHQAVGRAPYLRKLLLCLLKATILPTQLRTLHPCICSTHHSILGADLGCCCWCGGRLLLWRCCSCRLLLLLLLLLRCRRVCWLLLLLWRCATCRLLWPLCW
jgi:hypothetical protein